MTISDDEDRLLRSAALQNANSILVARQRAEQRSAAYLAEAQRLSRTGSFGWNVSTGELLWSDETYRIFEYDRTETPTVALVLQRVHPDDTALVTRTIERAEKDGRDFDFEHRLLMPDGSVKHLHVVAHALSDRSGNVEFVGAVMDVTGPHQANAALEALAGRLIHAQEEERRRIGRDLHDHVGQRLSVLTLNIDQLCADGATPPGIVAALQDLRQATEEISHDLRALSHRLHSSMLDHLGLIPALQKLVTEFSERHDIAIAFAQAGVPSSVPSDVALCLFRIAEESLTNIAKHSQARSASVRVTGQLDGIHLCVEDAGTGFDVARPHGGPGLGLVSMQERLRVLRGTLHVTSAPSRGTRIEVLIPSRIR